MDSKKHAKIFAKKYKESAPTQELNTCQYLEPSIFVNQLLVSPPRGTTIDPGEIDLLLPLQPTIFMTKRNSDRRSISTPKKSLLKRIFGFLR